MIAGRTVFCLAVAQLISWGVSYYLIGVFGALIEAEFGWGSGVVYGGFAAALLVMGATSSLAGRLIDRHGGRRMMIAGAALTALGCLMLAVCQSRPAYYAAWLVLGVAMRLSLYDAAFAALARIGGRQSRRAMSQITLLGGLASTAFWPIGHLLAQNLGWRGAVAAYAGFALLTVPLYLALPRAAAGPDEARRDTLSEPPPLASGPRDVLVLGGLYGLIVSLVSFLAAGMSAHMIGILTGLGVGGATAVWVAALRGVGQSVARLCEVLFGQRLDPLVLNLLAALVLPAAFAAGLLSGVSLAAAAAFAFLYGVGNGLLTLTRGSLPLVLLDRRTYGATVGRLIAPGFVLAAAAPVVYALAAERFGQAGVLLLSAALGAVALAASLLLWLLCRRRVQEG